MVKINISDLPGKLYFSLLFCQLTPASDVHVYTTAHMRTWPTMAFSYKILFRPKSSEPEQLLLQYKHQIQL